MELLKVLGKTIKTIRLKKELRQKEIADRCGFDKSSYKNIEKGNRNITILTLSKIAEALNEPMAYFIESVPERI